MKVFIETVGCPKNREDSERMAGLLLTSGHTLTRDADAADAVIVNTCGFIEAAKRESIETIFACAPPPESGRRLIVTGCLTQRYAAELFGELPEADAILGVNDYERLPEILRRWESTENNCDNNQFGAGEGRILFAEGAPSVLTGPRAALESRASSYLKLAEGCDNRCTYCVIPQIRGPYRSVPMETLLAEAESLAADGCRELTLIAQDVTNYGADLCGAARLPELLRALCRIPGIEWVRLLYCYEERVTDELIETIALEPKVCPYIDLPLQHVSASVLCRMGRRSSPESIRDTIGRLREHIPGIVIRTAFITGFPGETKADFEELCEFVCAQRLGRVGVFAYSREDGTPAAGMPDQVDAETAEARRDTLMRLQLEISREENERLIGSMLDVIVDEADKTESDGSAVFLGRTRGDAPEIDNAVIFRAPAAAGNTEDLIGRIVRVQITDAMDYDLVGEIVK